MSFSENLKRIRAERGLTQRDVASILGCSVQSYAQYESGKRKPKIETIKRFADALGVLVPDLYPEGWNDNEVQQYISENPASMEARAVEAVDYIYYYVLGKSINFKTGTACFDADEIEALLDSAISKAAKVFNIPENILRKANEENIISNYSPDANNDYQNFARQIFDALRLLNHTGQQTAVERVRELTEIPRYKAPLSPIQQRSTASKTGDDGNK